MVGMPVSSESQRESSTSYLFDGVEMRNPRIGDSSITPSLDAVQEFKLVSNNYSAEMGRAGGGFVNFNLRSGTNEIHGTAWEFLRNDALNANGFFTNQGTPDPVTGRAKRSVLRQNEFGATAGGPIKKDKTFAFGWYSGFRFQRGSQNSIVTMPTDAFKNGDFSQVLREQNRQIYDPATTRQAPSGQLVRDPFPNNIIPRDRMDPVALKVQAMIPAANRTGLTNNAIFPYPSARTTSIPAFKVDHSFSARSKVSYYYSRIRTYTDIGSGGDGLPQPVTNVINTDTVSPTQRLNYNLAMKPTLLFAAGVGYQVNHRISQPQVLDYNPEKELGLKGAAVNRLFPYFTGLTK